MSQYAPEPPILQEMSHREGLIIVAAVACLLIGLVILRFGCNIAIDVCILRDMTAARGTIREFFPCWRRLRQQSGEEVDDDERGTGESEMATVANASSLLHRLTAQEKIVLIDSILKSKVVTKEDLADWNETHCSNSRGDCETPEDSDKEATQDTVSVATNEGAMCSICLHDFELGQHISETKACGHVFHGDCIKLWIASHNSALCCPYCRTSIITEADVKRTLRRVVTPTV